MKVEVLHEAGYQMALFGQGFSYGLTSRVRFEDFNQGRDLRELWDRMRQLLGSLAHRGGGHDKALRMVHVWLDITAAREWWSQMDTYKVGTVALSESTMHTLTKRLLTPDDFEQGVDLRAIEVVNEYIAQKDWVRAKKNLPEAFLQRRIWEGSYMTLSNIIEQRKAHKLKEWRMFCALVIGQLEHPELIELPYDNFGGRA